MSLFTDIFDNFKNRLHRYHSVETLRILIILVSVFFIILALTINNKWILAGILLYQALP